MKSIESARDQYIIYIRFVWSTEFGLKKIILFYNIVSCEPPSEIFKTFVQNLISSAMSYTNHWAIRSKNWLSLAIRKIIQILRLFGSNLQFIWEHSVKVPNNEINRIGGGSIHRLCMKHWIWIKRYNFILQHCLQWTSIGNF